MRRKLKLAFAPLIFFVSFPCAALALALAHVCLCMRTCVCVVRLLCDCTADGEQVDCVAERELCATQNLMAFPTIRFFKVSYGLPGYVIRFRSHPRFGDQETGVRVRCVILCSVR